jgi:8-oxo-dGTP pyrophosphatase MutT (NUDIX family)
VTAFDWAEVVERVRSGGELPSRAADEGAEAPRAAVASILRQGMEDVELLFIKRAERQGDPWSGHVAFPGGKREVGDASLLATAVRETEEEVGLRLEPRSFVTRLHDVRARINGYRVAHFVFRLDDRAASLAMSPEVAAVLWVPLATLAEVERAEGDAPGQRAFPSVKLGDYVLWGMTYRMVGHLLDAVESRR